MRGRRHAAFGMEDGLAGGLLWREGAAAAAEFWRGEGCGGWSGGE